jgi:ankyrin repeat protein
LLVHGALINEEDNNRCTPLYFASLHGYNECIKTLLTHGATINEKNNWGYTPLHYASINGYNECIKTFSHSVILLENGADFNIKNNNGLTPIDVANDKHKTVIKQWIEDNELPMKEPSD